MKIVCFWNLFVCLFVLRKLLNFPKIFMHCFFRKNVAVTYFGVIPFLGLSGNIIFNVFSFKFKLFFNKRDKQKTERQQTYFCLSELVVDDETTNIVLQFLLDFLHQFKEDHARTDDICRLLSNLRSFIKLFETKVGVLHFILRSFSLFRTI